MYPDIPDGYAGWLLRHLKSKPLRLYSSILVLILCSLGLPLSSEMSVPSLKFIHVSASVQCRVVASSSSGSLGFDSRLRFCLGFSVGFHSVFSLQSSVLFSLSLSFNLVSRLLDFVFKFRFIPVSPL